FPRLFFMSRVGSLFNTPIFPDASSSACKCPSILSSTGSPERTNWDSLKVRHHLHGRLLVSGPQSTMDRALEDVDGQVSQDQEHKVARLRPGVEFQPNQLEARDCEYPPEQSTQARHPRYSSAEPQIGREV